MKISPPRNLVSLLNNELPLTHVRSLIAGLSNVWGYSGVLSDGVTEFSRDKKLFLSFIFEFTIIFSKWLDQFCCKTKEAQGPVEANTTYL